METNNIMPFAFTEGQSPKDKSQNIIKVIGVGGGGSNAVLNMYKQVYTMYALLYVIPIARLWHKPIFR